MIKKYKNLLKGITFSIVVLAIIAILGETYGLYNPTTEQFLNDDASTILGQNFYMAGNWWNDTYYNKHQMDCWAHNVTQPLEAGGVNNHIHSVYDIDFDESKGVMKVYSIIEDANKTSKTTYADGTNTTLGRLAYEASKSGNIEKVYRAIGQAMNAGVVVNDQVITGFSNQWNVKFEDKEGAIYNNYKALSVVQNTVQETGDTVQINGEDYTVIGHFKVNYGGVGIESINIGNGKWSDSNQYKEIYWRYADTNKAQNWHSNFNESKSGKYELDGNSFDIAVKTSTLPSDGNYKITVKQKEFKYYKARIVVTAGRKLQQFGMYAYDNTPKTYVGKAEWNVSRIPTDKNLIIAKSDKKSGEKITGAGFKIYAVLKDGTKGWVSGSVTADKKYESSVANATEYSDDVEIKTLKLGEYYIFETKAPEGYELSTQENYMKAKEGIQTPSGEWAYVGSTTLNAKSGKTVTYKVTNKKPVLGTTKIIKIDEDTKQEITGGQFKIYAVIDENTKGWVNGEASGTKTYESDNTKAKVYDSDVNIEKLKPGKYYYFETKAPEGYDMKKQEGYKTNKDLANIAPSDSEWVYLGNKEIPKDVEETQVLDFTATNKKVVDKLEGTVFRDYIDTKLNEKNDSIYTKNAKDTLLEGIKVTLYDNNQKAIATTTTNKEGYYCFTKKDNGEDLYYWELTKGYVEFSYDNKEFVCVDVFAGNDVKVNSKAQEYTISTEKLDDNKLTGVDGENSGKATTYRSNTQMSFNEILENNRVIREKIDKKEITSEDLIKTPLTGYYDTKTYTISDINLGLVGKITPEFAVSEDLAYIKVKMNGYTYTYKYGEQAVTNSDFVMTVNEQTNAKTFTGSIYPSDIAYNKENSTDELKVYAVYEIKVQNTMADDENSDNIYNEQKLYLSSLENVYDTERYELSNKDNSDDKNSQEFALWSGENGKATYNLNSNTDAFENGIKHNQPISTYIQFRVKEEALQKILDHTLDYKDVEKAPTKAKAKGYHEYLRTDNAWVHDEKVYAFDGYSNSQYDKQNKDGNKYYVHKSLDDERSSTELYLLLQLKGTRTLSGKVYEEFATNGALGNGYIDEKETNRAKDVKVELLKADRNTVAELYQVNKDGSIVYDEQGKLLKAEKYTKNGGEYSFEGVVPGYYYIRFTYGDGTQKIVDTKGNEVSITSNEYKSTIIDSTTNEGKIIQAIKEANENTISNAQQVLVKDYNNEEAKKLVEWYKYIGKEHEYSTAIDEIEYTTEGKVYEKGSTEKSENVNSYTPIFGISIENDKENVGQQHNESYDVFNFGIIKAPETTTKLKKEVSNVKLTNQASMTNISASPKDKDASYISEIDKIVKLEIDQDKIYGSDLEVEYVITITNESPEDYIETSKDEYGYYYKYGEKTSTATQKGVTIEEVQDMIDGIYNEKGLKVTAYYVDGKETNTEISITPTGAKAGEEGDLNVLTITGMENTELKPGQSESIKYTAHAILASEQEDENGIINDARVTKIGVAPLTKPNIPEWPDDEITITLTPPTGSNKDMTYYVAGAIALIVLATGIIIIKKRVLK